MSALRIGFSWPRALPAAQTDNFFFGIWHPQREITVRWHGEPPAPVATLAGRNWALASAVSPLHAPRGALLHQTPDGDMALAFRGYVVAPPLHSYSSGSELIEYWQGDPWREHNGVFSVARITGNGAGLLLATDLLGFAPLYYMRLDGALVFATNPRWLATPGAPSDLVAWRGLLESGFLASERTLTEGVHRLPAGKALAASGGSLRLASWLELDALPKGDRRLDAAGVAEVERVFHEAMDRCLALPQLDVLLPLSSGHDSRRILSSLLGCGRPFEAVTCRVFHQGRDLDARYAVEMARDLKLRHRVIEPAPAGQYAHDDLVRQVLTDAETGMHSWVPRLMASLPSSPAMLLDGIAGDILGNPGFRIPGLYESRERDIEIILDASLPGAYERVLARAAWPDAVSVREDLRSYLLSLPQEVNLAEFAFILLRQRRTTAPWSQQLLPPGHVTVCPFLDLEYLRLLLSFVPADKHATILQRRCLAEFWPDLYRYPGTRDIPQEVRPRSARIDREMTLACASLTLAELTARDGLARLRGLLSARGKLALRASRASRQMMLHALWQLGTLEELVLRELDRQYGWERE